MALARKIAFNVFFNSIAKVVSTALALVGIGFITRYLGKEGFGDYATVLAFFSFFGAIADLGLYAIATREISRPEAKEQEIIGKVLSLRLFSSLIVFFLAPLIIFFLPYSSDVRWGILIAAAAFVFSSSYTVLNGVFQKNIAMNKVTASEALGKALQVGLIALAVTQDWGFLGIMLAFLFGILFNFGSIFLLSRKYIKLSFSIDFPYWKKFIRESFPMGLAMIVTFLYFKMDTILLSVLRSSGDVGIYNAAYKIIESLTFFPGMVIGLIFPLMSRYIFSDKEKFESISNKTFKIFVILVIPLVIGTLFLADQVIAVIGGGGFAESATVLRILVISLGFIFFGNFFNNILIAGNLQKKLLLVLSVCAVFNITTNLFLIPRFSYLGAAFTSTLTEMLVVILTAYLVFSQIGYLPRIKNLSRIFFSGAVMILFLWLFREKSFGLLLIGSPLLYFVFLWLTRAISNEEILSIVSRQSSDESDIITQ